MIRFVARGAVCAIACGVLVLGSSAVPASSEQADRDRDVTCASDSGGLSWYPGPSASKVYDDMFSDSMIDIPGLDAGFVPQGMALWNGMLLISAYLPNDEDDDTKAEKAARIFAVHAQTGNYVGSVAINPSHAGGVAVVDDWVFVQGPRPDDKFTVEKYMATHVMVGLTTPVDRISPMGEPQVLEGGASSFLATDGHTLYAGKHNIEKMGFMHEYDVAANGTVQQGRRYNVPSETQGLGMASGEWVYSTSYGRQNVSEIHLLPDGEGNIGEAKCFDAPSMSEGIVAAHGSVYLLFESGAEPYDGARNPITTLHKVSIEELSDYGD